MIPKIMKYVNRFVTRQEKTPHRPQTRPHRQKSESSRSILVHYGLGDTMVMEVA